MPAHRSATDTEHCTIRDVPVESPGQGADCVVGISTLLYCRSHAPTGPEAVLVSVILKLMVALPAQSLTRRTELVQFWRYQHDQGPVPSRQQISTVPPSATPPIVP
jgi:hypothetical protein